MGTGGHGRKKLEGKGPTPRAEDRPYHKAYKQKKAAEHRAATGAADTLGRKIGEWRRANGAS